MFDYNSILDFWFTEPMSSHWFNSTQKIDDEITKRFYSVWLKAKSGKYDEALNDPKGTLALCIVLDQFPLNMFRGKAESFSTEQRAIHCAKIAIQKNYLKQLPTENRSFLLMPLMHSENLKDQKLVMELAYLTENEDFINFAKHHFDIIKKYGRFPHRNSILGRINTPQEDKYLNSEKAFRG